MSDPMPPTVVNPRAVGDPNQTPVVYIGDAGEVLGIPERSARRRTGQTINGERLKLWIADYDHAAAAERNLWPVGARVQFDRFGQALADLDAAREQLHQAQVDIATLTNNYRVAAEEEEAAKAERDAAREALRRVEAKVADYENAITWDVTCFRCAAQLDAMYDADARRERAEHILQQVQAVVDRGEGVWLHGRRWVSIGQLREALDGTDNTGGTDG